MKGGARYDKEGNLLTVRGPSLDPCKMISVSMPGRLCNKWKKHCKDNGYKSSKIIQRLMKEELRMTKDGLQRPARYAEEPCPVCGYYCLGKGGHGCIDKPSA